MKKLLLALLVVGTTGNIVAGFGEDNLNAHESYRNDVANRKLSSQEAQGHWDHFKSRLKKAQPVQNVKAKSAAKAA